MTVSRRCDFWKATDDNWYLLLGDFEHAEEDEDCTAYGPFPSEEAANDFQRKNFSNPGGSCTDDSGTEPPPENPVLPRKFYRRGPGFGF